MIRKLFAIVLLSLTVAACESSSPETNSNANNPSKVSGQVSPTPVPSPSPEPSPLVHSQLKAGDKVRVTANGAITNATVVSVDETAGKVTVKLDGESRERTVAISDVVKQ
jgi:hypothetical protein